MLGLEGTNKPISPLEIEHTQSTCSILGCHQDITHSCFVEPDLEVTHKQHLFHSTQSPPGHFLVLCYSVLSIVWDLEKTQGSVMHSPCPKERQESVGAEGIASRDRPPGPNSGFTTS